MIKRFVKGALPTLGRRHSLRPTGIDAGSFSGEALEAAQNLRSSLQNQKDQITDVLNRAREKANN